MEHAANALFSGVFLVDANTPCQNGGTAIVQGFSTIINVGKYLLGLSIFLGAAIWLVTEFFREAQTGAFKVSSFVFAHQLPLLLLLLGVGLLMGFSAGDFLKANGASASNTNCTGG